MQKKYKNLFEFETYVIGRSEPATVIVYMDYSDEKPEMKIGRPHERITGPTRNFNPFDASATPVFIDFFDEHFFSGISYFTKDDEIWYRVKTNDDEVSEGLAFNKVRTRMLKEIYEKEVIRHEDGSR